MSLNVFLLLVAYYVLKTVREPLILIGRGRRAQVLRRCRPGPDTHRLRPTVWLVGDSAPAAKVSQGGDSFFRGLHPALLLRRQDRSSASGLHLFCVGGNFQSYIDCAVLVLRERDLFPH